MLKNHHYSKWALAKSMYVAPFIVFLLLLNCKHNPQEELLLEENNPTTEITDPEPLDFDLVDVILVDKDGKERTDYTIVKTEKTKDKKTETFPDDAVFSWVTDIDIIDGEKIHNKVDVMPEPIGGMPELYKSIRENTTYPQEARDKGIQGTVVVKFVVTKEGSVSNVQVVKGIDPHLDAAAVHAVKKLPKWKPGIMHGQFVSCWYNLPVTFTLQ